MFVPAYQIEAAPGATPTHTAFLLHGILGSRRNWRTMARTLVRAHPDWQVVLVDLRCHGDSKAPPPPHTLAACAEDLRYLADEVADPSVIIGHSFGGKVAMTYAREHGEGLEECWVLDATPEAGYPAADVDNEVLEVLETLEQIVMPLEEREDVIDILEGKGFSTMLARWMTTNLEAGPHGGFVWRFDLDGVRELLGSYYTEDLMPFLAAPGCDVHIVRAGRSNRWTPELVHTLETMSSRVHTQEIANAGHWLHVDAPKVVASLLGDALRRAGGLSDR